MKREIRFVVDCGDALDVMKQFTDEKTANEALIRFGYLAHPAPDIYDWIRAILLYPYRYFNHIIYQRRTKRAAANQ